MIRMKPWLLGLSLAAAVFAAGCGGGGSSADNPTTPEPPVTPEPPTTGKVAGPLDAVQTPLSETVLGQLAGAVADTPLAPVIASADQIVVQDLLDIVDAVALGLQQAATTGNPAALADSAPQVQAQVMQMVTHLRGLLDALAAGTGGTGGIGSNPLAGTPLAPLGDALTPVLAQIGALGTGGSSGTDLNLTQLAYVVSLLNNHLQTGLSQIPAEARNAPVVGAVFTTLSTSLTDVTGLLAAASTYNATTTTARVQTTVNNLLTNVLTGIVPVHFLEQQTGNPGVLSSQIEAGIAQVSAVLGENLGVVLTPVLEDLLGGALSPLLDPIENQVLPAVLTPIIDALSGGLPGVGGSGFGGTQLGGLLGLVTDALASTPLGDLVDDILGPVLCLFAGTPLSFLCPSAP